MTEVEKAQVANTREEKPINNPKTAKTSTTPTNIRPAFGTRNTTLDKARELCEATKHREPYHLTLTGPTRYHATTSPPLITQLHAAIEPSTSTSTGTRPAASSPAARIDAIDTAIRIETDAARWLRRLGLDDTADTITLIRQLTPHAATNRDIAHDIHRWWTWARITTGWDLPAWRPDNTCPLCGTRGTLRIRVIEKLATCINDTCRETWNETTIGLLADHIRSENGDWEQAS